MPDAPVPMDPAADPAAGAPMGNLFESYQGGSPNDLFAPAFIRGYQPSMDAVAAWQAANRGMGRSDVEATRMVQPWTDPTKTLGGDGVYGGPLPQNQTYGDKRGMVDPEALRVWSQGGRYDMNARRDAIAARLAANAAAAAAANPTAPASQHSGWQFGE